MPESPDSFDLNNQQRGADTTPQIPSSASEVAVRTMASDLELMGRSGGMASAGAPQAMQVPVTLHPETAPASVGAQPAAATAPPVPQAPSARGKHILITVGVIVGILALLALGYFVAGL